MSKKPQMVIAALLALLVVGAGAASNPDPAHSSRVSLDWAGTYRGVVPCADCAGIETTITLKENGTFLRSRRYLGREDAYDRDQGRFEWNDAGSVVTLGPEAQAYQVGENRLFHLDRAGQRIEGPLAERYVLMKDRSDPLLEDRAWVLTNLFGAAVTLPEGQAPPSIFLDASTGRVRGSDGCNRIMGTYELTEEGRLAFGALAGTLMACREMALPDRFRTLLASPRRYSVRDGELLLIDDAGNAVARFSASAQGDGAR